MCSLTFVSLSSFFIKEPPPRDMSQGHEMRYLLCLRQDVQSKDCITSSNVSMGASLICSFG